MPHERVESQTQPARISHRCRAGGAPERALPPPRRDGRAARALQRSRGRATSRMVSSFGAESVVLLHLVAMARPHDAGAVHRHRMLFAETLVYQQEVAERLGLHGRARRSAGRGAAEAARSRRRAALLGPRRLLRAAQDRAAGARAAGFDGWITGRKRYQRRRARGARLLRARGGDAAGSRSTRWPIGSPRTCTTTWTKTACPGIRWWPGLSLDRLRALHLAGGRGRGPARRPLARPGQGRMRHPFRGRHAPRDKERAT